MKFELGYCVTTRGVANKMEYDEEFRKFVHKSFERHTECDWGDLDSDDKEANDMSVANGGDMILSKYNYDNETSIYIITEWDRSETTILFPSEY